MAQWVEYWPHKHEDLGMGIQTVHVARCYCAYLWPQCPHGSASTVCAANQRPTLAQSGEKGSQGCSRTSTDARAPCSHTKKHMQARAYPHTEIPHPSHSLAHRLKEICVGHRNSHPPTKGGNPVLFFLDDKSILHHCQ